MGIKFPETKKIPYRIKADVDMIVLTLVKCTKTFPYVKKMLKRYYGCNIYYEIYCKTLKKISKIPYKQFTIFELNYESKLAQCSVRHLNFKKKLNSAISRCILEDSLITARRNEV